jgi:hypothetical protein
METITCKNAYYVKLGRNGIWEDSSIKKRILRIGWSKQKLSDINKGSWNLIQKQLEDAIPDKGTATRDYRALRMLCESTAEDIWITFHDSHLWWCKVAEKRIFEDKVSKYRKVEDWYCKDVFGNSLLINQIPGRISKLQGFRGTICKVKEVEELTGLINRQYSSEFVAITHSRVDLCRHVEKGLRRLHWKDFETLVDLLFRATGWRRVSVLGENMKYLDIELEEPINGEMYQVQVKSSASFRDFQEYAKKFQSEKYRKLFFVVHTPDKKLIEMPNQTYNPVQLVLPGRLAEMVVDLGMVAWLLNKIR